MTLRSLIAKVIGKASYWFLSSFTKGGSSLPGKLALTLDSQILAELSQNYRIVIITGTNGKTLTTALTSQILKEKFPKILTNSTGSNMAQGIVSTFLTHAPLKEGEQGIAVLEVDEASLKNVVPYLKPELFVVTNIFPDQLDRFGNVETIRRLIYQAISSQPQAKLLVNGDSPLLTSTDWINPVSYFGFELEEESINHSNMESEACPNCGSPLSYSFQTYANLGKYHCSNCEFSRPNVVHQVSKISQQNLHASSFEMDGQSYEIPVAGIYNIYNALAAYCVGRYFDLSPEQCRQGFAKMTKVDGRQETFNLSGKMVQLNLVKNPVGLNQILDMITMDPTPKSLIAILNNNYADGRDPSWIEEGNFESLADSHIQELYAGGIAKELMANRLKSADIIKDRIQLLENLTDVVTAIEHAQTDNVYIIATYTAMLELRKILQSEIQ